MARGDPQLNIRLGKEQNEVLEAAAWVRRSSRQELGKEAVMAMIRRFSKDPAVKTALAARAQADAETEKKVRRIDSSRQQRRET
jgi:hypothetical protein